MAIYDLIAGNAIGFAGGAISTGGNTYAIGNTLTFTLSAVSSLNVATPANAVPFSQDLSFTISRSYSVSSELLFSDMVAKPVDLWADNVVRFTQDASNAIFESASNVLAFVQDAVGSRGNENSLTFSQTLSVGFVRNISVTNVLTYVSSFSYTFDGLQVTIPVPSVPAPSGVLLTFGTLSVQLPSPEFGNVNGLAQSRIQMSSRGGDLIIYRDPSWPTTETLKYQFKDLSNSRAKRFLAFIDASLGQDITLVDYEGVSWTGIITNPDTAVTQEGPELGAACGGFNVEIEFQGVMS